MPLGADLAAARLRSNHLGALPEQYRRLVDVDRGLDVDVSCQCVTEVAEDDMRWPVNMRTGPATCAPTRAEGAHPHVHQGRGQCRCAAGGGAF